jgi:hypothetical protein
MKVEDAFADEASYVEGPIEVKVGQVLGKSVEEGVL